MSDENGGDRSQKTVAELLALHGSSTGSSRRRHRRAADADETDDATPASGRDITDTAPQAIIDRIKGEGDAGKQSEQHSAGEAHGPSRVAQGPPQQQPQSPQPPPHPQPQQASWPQPAQARHDQQSPPPPQQQSRPMPRPSSPTNGHAPAPQPPQPPQQREQRAPEPNGSQGGADQHRADQHRADEPGAEPTPQPRSRGGFPRPPGGRRAPLRPAQRREPEPNTDRFPALGGEAGGQNGHAQPTPDVSASAPPAGLTKWRQRRQKEQAEETDIGVVPPVPADADPAAPVQADGAPPTGAFTPSFDTGPQASVTAEPGAGEYTDGEAGYADYGYTDYDYANHDYYDDQHYSYDERDQNLDYDDEFEGEFAETGYADEDEGGDLEEPADERSPARQWLLLAGQLALGVVAGAGVWLGFSWLWGQMPSAALVAALLATLGLVWVVRKVRRAEDTQTTVLALLVGLVVTVSPAALLLVSR